LTDLSQLYVEFSVPQQDLSLVGRDAKVSVTTDGWPGRTFTGTVNAIEPQIDVNTRNVTVQALMPNPDKALRPGMYVDVAVNLPPQHDALLVPVTAIQTSASGESIVVVRDISSDGGGVAEIVPVTTGRRMGDQVIVETGLKPGDVVVTQGQIRVRPGRPVTSVANASAADTDAGGE